MFDRKPTTARVKYDCLIIKMPGYFLDYKADSYSKSCIKVWLIILIGG